jgi:hypothetical protein
VTKYNIFRYVIVLLRRKGSLLYNMNLEGCVMSKRRCYQHVIDLHNKAFADMQMSLNTMFSLISVHYCGTGVQRWTIRLVNTIAK